MGGGLMQVVVAVNFCYALHECTVPTTIILARIEQDALTAEQPFLHAVQTANCKLQMWEGNAATMIIRRPLPNNPGRVHRMAYTMSDTGLLAVRYEIFDETTQTSVETIGAVDVFAALPDMRVVWPTIRLGLVANKAYDAFVGASLTTPDGASQGAHSDRLTYSVTGSLPSGLVIGPNGRVRGTLTGTPPTTPTTVRLSIHDLSSGTRLDTVTLTSLPPPKWITPEELGVVIVNVAMAPIDLVLEAPAAGAPAFVRIISSTLGRSNIALTGPSNSRLTGTPSDLGAHQIVVRASYADSYLGFTDRTFRLACTPPAIVSFAAGSIPITFAGVLDVEPTLVQSTGAAGQVTYVAEFRTADHALQASLPVPVTGSVTLVVRASVSMAQVASPATLVTLSTGDVTPSGLAKDVKVFVQNYRVCARIPLANGTSVDVVPRTATVNGAWIVYALVIDAATGSVKMYADGREVASQACSPALLDLTVAKIGDGSGVVADVSHAIVYASAMSGDDVYAAGPRADIDSLYSGDHGSYLVRWSPAPGPTGTTATFGDAYAILGGARGLVGGAVPVASTGFAVAWSARRSLASQQKTGRQAAFSFTTGTLRADAAWTQTTLTVRCGASEVQVADPTPAMQWGNYAVAHDGSSVSVYIGGSSINSVASSASEIPTEWSATSIGAADPQGTDGMTGDVGHVRYYASGSDIANIAAIVPGLRSDLPPFDPGLAVHADLPNTEPVTLATLGDGNSTPTRAIERGARTIKFVVGSRPLDSGPISVSCPSGSVSIAARFRVDAYTVFPRIFRIGTVDNYEFKILGSTDGRAIGIDGNALGSGGVSSPGVVLKQWYVIVGVYDAALNKMTMYINGTETGSATITSKRNPLPTEYKYAASSTTPATQRQFAGAISHIGVYGRAVTAAEARSITDYCSS